MPPNNLDFSKVRVLSICQNWPAKTVSSQTECTNLKDKFYPNLSTFFKIARINFGVIIFQDFAVPSLKNDAFDLQTGRSGLPVMANGERRY